MLILGKLLKIELDPKGALKLIKFNNEISKAVGDRLEGIEVATKEVYKENEEGCIELILSAFHGYTGMAIDSFTITLTVEQIEKGIFPNAEEIAERRVKGIYKKFGPIDK